MKKVFYCPSCDYVGAAEETEMHLCPRCECALYRTEMDRQNYIGLTDAEKDAAKAQWREACSAGEGTPCYVGDASPEKTVAEGGNGVAGALKAIAILFYIFAVLAFFILLSNEAGAISWIALASGIVSGTLFLGFSEIIRLLDVISKKN